ncbi:unnamed protein product [Cuscuta epithymum]|uniref:Uncharacterized protein n=1 Tax=Cuscuta epithymum TaxID=186058 RepID=A0AAV0CM96_9ASTE|nr:unnamed protein product [Cuscuta epithymum]
MKSLQQRHHISLQLPTSDGNSPVIFSGGNMVTYDRIGSFTVLFLEESAESNPSLLFFLERPAMDGVLHCFFFFGQPAMDGVLHCFSALGSLLWMKSFIVWAACYGWSPSLFFFFGQLSMDGILRCLGSLLWMGSFIVFFFGQPLWFDSFDALFFERPTSEPASWTSTNSPLL